MLYEYNGPVLKFGVCIDHIQKKYTYARSKGQARNNITYRYKKDNGLTSNAKITLPGEITEVKKGETYGVCV